MDNEVEIVLMVLEPVEYASLELTGPPFDGCTKSLAELFPNRMYVLGTADMACILEVAPHLTDKMRKLMGGDVVAWTMNQQQQQLNARRD